MTENSIPETEKRILWIVPRVPWPPRCGASTANCCLIQCLSKFGWKIDLLCFSEKPTALEHDIIINHLNVDSIDYFESSPSLRFRPLRLLLSIFLQFRLKGIPITAVPFSSKRVTKKILEKIRLKNQKMVLWDGLHPMASIVNFQSVEQTLKTNELVQIYRAHNYETGLWLQYQLKVCSFLRPIFKFQTKAMKEFEKNCVNLSSAVLCMSENDTELFKALSDKEKPILTVPLSLAIEKREVEIISSIRRRERMERITKHLSILWLGGMDWWPNRDGLLWFLKHVWPAAKNRRNGIVLNLIGKGTDHIKIEKHGQIRAHGFLPNLRTLLAQADLLIVPIFFGSGVRIKAIEALSFGIPCLGTEVGLRGVPHEGCWLSQSAREWSLILQELDPTVCLQKGISGQEMLKKENSTEVIGRSLNDLLSRLMRDKPC